MTIKDWRKVYNQLKEKPSKWKKYIKHNAPKKRTTGMRLTKCQMCGRYDGHINKYDLNLCRCCFREMAPKIGFKKYN